MGLFDRVEGKLERAYNGLFARAFRAEVQPVEIASAIRRAMDDRASGTGSGKGRAVVPNLFTIELSETDYERLTDFGDDVSDELVVAAEEHVNSQHYTPGGPVRIVLTEDADLETGVFRVRPATVKKPDATGRTGLQPKVAEAASAGALGGAAAAGAGALARPSRTPQPTRTPEPPAYDDDLDDLDAHDDSESFEEPTTPAPPPPARKPRRPAHRPSLVIGGDDYPLTSAITILGRDDEADIILDDPGISRRHTELRVSIDGPGFITVIRDLGSTNGTFINGERVDHEHLEDGDQITVGRTSMTYRVRTR